MSANKRRRNNNTNSNASAAAGRYNKTRRQQQTIADAMDLNASMASNETVAALSATEKQEQQQQLSPPAVVLTAAAIAAAAAAAAEMSTKTAAAADNVSASSSSTTVTAGATSGEELPRICRCCCKNDIELLEIFATDRQKKSPSAADSTQRRRIAEAEAQRKNQNPIEYALSGSRSSMDTVLEEINIWQLNINRDDGLPQQICLQCKAQFLMIAKFRRRCLRMQQRLQVYNKHVLEHKQPTKVSDTKLETVEQEPQLFNDAKETTVAAGASTATAAVSTEAKAASAETAAAAAAAAAAKAESQTIAPQAKNDPRSSIFHMHMESPLKGNVDMNVDVKPPEKLMQTPPDLTTQTADKTAKDKQPEKPSATCADYMHLPELQLERERRQQEQTVKIAETAAEDEVVVTAVATTTCKTEDTTTAADADLPTPPKLRKLQLRLRKLSHTPKTDEAAAKSATGDAAAAAPQQPLSDMPAICDESSTETSPIACIENSTAFSPVTCNENSTSISPVSCDESSTEIPPVACNESSTETSPEQPPYEEIGKLSPVQMPWKTKAARKEIATTDEATDASTATNSCSLPCSPTTVESAAEQLSDLSVGPCPGFDSDAGNSSSSNGLQAKYPRRKHKTVTTLGCGLRRGLRNRKTLPQLPVQRARRLLRLKQQQQRSDKRVARLRRLQQAKKQSVKQQSPQLRESLTPEVPAAECEVEIPLSVESPAEPQSELLVSIPLATLSEDLQRKLCPTDDLLPAEPKEPTAPDEVNNNENAENFWESATADSFNAAAALKEPQIEATTEEEPLSTKVLVAETPPAETDQQKATELQTLPEQLPDIEATRAGAPVADNASETPVDFFAEFRKHCENSLDAALQEPVDAAKQQLEVEMNDVEITLNGILNEMQDQHIYTPVCPNVDEFLTPADYAPIAEQESPVQIPQPAKPNELNELLSLGTSTFNNYEVFPSGTAAVPASELIAFQNDIPCFENIEDTAAAANESHNNLQLELTQLLNELQPPTQQVIEQPPPPPPQVVIEQTPPPPPPTPAQPPVDAAPAQLAVYESAEPAQLTLSYEPSYANVSDYTADTSKLQLISLPPEQQLYTQQPAQQQLLSPQLQWSTITGLEAIKSTIPQMDNNGTTTYYINASDLYGQPAAAAPQTLPSYASLRQPHSLDNNENYLEQGNQPMLILIQQPEMAQPVASASNPQQPPLLQQSLQLYGAPISNDLHTLQHHQLPQQHHQQQLQHRQQLPQQVQRQTVLRQSASNRVVTLKCRFCHNGPRFSNNLEYSQHVIEMHPAVSPFNCPHCPLTFAGRNKRAQHILAHHFVQRFQCGQCAQVFPAQRALDLHLQRYHAPAPPIGVRIEEVQLQMSETPQPVPELETPARAPSKKTRILCCPDCEDCTSPDGHHQDATAALQSTPMILSPPSTIASQPSPQPPPPPPLVMTPHITMPSPEQSEPDSTTTLRQFRKRRSSPCANASPLTPMNVASNNTHSPSSSPSSSTNEQQHTTGGDGSGGGGGGSNMLKLSELRTKHNCIYCEEHFTNDIALRKHLQLAHGAQTTMPFVCTICKRGYRMRTALHRHMETHDAEGRPYECNICRVRFPRPSQLTLHKITVHLLSKPHTCDECGKQFGTESALKTHIKFHGEHGYQCDQCKSTFIYQRDLRKHRRTHAGELFYKCEYCARSFMHYTVFRAHMNSHLPMGIFLTDETTALQQTETTKHSAAAPLPALDSSSSRCLEDVSNVLTPLSNDDCQTAMSPALQTVESSGGSVMSLEVAAAMPP